MKLAWRPKDVSDAVKQRSMRQLNRLEILIDVIYGILIFRVFTLLPSPDVDGFGVKELVDVLKDSITNYTALAIGIFMIIIYWSQSNLQLGNLDQTRSTHATFSILQIILLMIYFYFVNLDIRFESPQITMQMQSLFLGLAGVMSILGWHYAVRHDLVSRSVSAEEKSDIYLKLIPEPIVSFLTIPFAFISPTAWSLSWLLLIPAIYVTKLVIRRQGRR